MMNRCASLAGAVLLAVPVAALADPEIQFLTVGDKAPAIEVAHWLRGKEIPQWEPGKVYVLEFWATWCGPCRAAMPHLSDLQKEYKDYGVTCIGISDEPLAKVVQFLFETDKRDGKTNQERTQYTLCTDPDKSVHTAYFSAAGQRGIPCSFIVGKTRRIEWIGHPMGIDEPLGAVVRDEWDREAFKRTWDERQEQERAQARVAQARRKAIEDKNWDELLRLMDEAIAKNPENPGPKAEKFMLLAREVGDYARAYAYAATVVEESWDEPMWLNQIAWFIVDEKGLEKRDLDLAMKAANRADVLSKHEDPAILDTVARVWFEKGDIAKAREIQRAAVEVSKGTPFEEQLGATLKRYEEAAPPTKK
jgi:thiol-disulfide isomerase/thioredoxin